MNHKERMEQGLIYNPNLPEITGDQFVYMDKLWEFNQLKPSQFAEKERYMKEMFAECGENCYIELPFRANWGGKNVHFGNGVYANFNLTLVDDGDIYIDDKVMFGPNVTIATANHPIDPGLREKAMQYNKPVHICENVRIGHCPWCYHREKFCHRCRQRCHKRHSGECGGRRQSLPCAAGNRGT